MAENKFSCLHELCIEAIEFDKSEFVTLYCRQDLGGGIEQFELDCHFSQLDELLRLSGADGEEVAIALSDRLLCAAIDEEELLEIAFVLGRHLIIGGFDFVMYEVETVENPLESFYSKPTKAYCLDRFFESQRFAYGTVDYEDFIELLKPYSLKLTQLYFNYQNACKNGYSEWEARRMFGLERHFFFNLAKELAEMWD